MTDKFKMPILGEKDARCRAADVSFTWEPTAQHRDRALSNHSQTLERLRERGGLGWTELYCVLHDRELFSIAHNKENSARAKAWILQHYPQ